MKEPPPATPHAAEAIFNTALELGLEQRSEYLANACAGDSQLQRRVEALLRAHQAADGFLPETPARHLQTGSHVGDYELLQEIARGGMGVVFRARQRSLNRIVAVKMILSGEFAGQEQTRRFRAEAESTARLQHPNIVAIHEVGEHDGQPFFSMEYVEGQNLAQHLRERPPSIRCAAKYLKAIAEAVDHAHQRGVLHRDLKPSNILIDQTGQPRITDFGVAKRFASAQEPPSPSASAASSAPAASNKGAHLFEPTRTGQLLGSPSYMPPEQGSSRYGQFGPAGDIYSLGAILYHLLTGRPPFVADSVEDTLLQLFHREPVPLRLLNPALPRDLETICLKCLHKDPARRYASAQALADELDRYLKGKPILAHPAGPIERLWRWSRKHPTLAAGIIVLLVATAASTWTALRFRRLIEENRLRLYAQDMNVALRSWQEGSTAQALSLLKRQIPGNHQPDLRGFEWRYLWKLCRGNYSRWLPAHPQVVGMIQFSPDDQLVATFAWNGRARVWRLSAPHPQNLFVATNVTGLGGFTSDGRGLVVSRGDQSVQLLDPLTGQTNRVLKDVGELVAFAPAGPLVVTITKDNVLKVSHFAEEQPRLSLPGMTRQKLNFGWGNPATVSADGTRLARIQPSQNPLRSDPSIRLWDLRTGQELRPLPENRQLRCLEFSPNGAWLAVGDGEGSVKLWNIETREFRLLRAHSRPVLTLAFSPDGQRLATGSSGPDSIGLWRIPSGEPVPGTFTGQAGDVWSLAFSRQGNHLASGSRDDPIRIWNLTEKDPGEVVPQRLHADEYGNFCFSPNGKLMAAGCADHTVKVWDVASLQVRSVLSNATDVAEFSKDGTELLTSTKEGTPQWWNIETGARRPIPSYQGSLSHVVSVGLSPDRRIGALGLANGEIQLLEIDSGTSLGPPLEGHRAAVNSLTFSPNGRTLASGGSDRMVMVWDLETHRGLGMCPEHKGGVFGVAISPNGQTLASGCGAETIKFWTLLNVSTGSISSFSYHASVVRTLAFSVDGRTLASGSEDNTVKLWNVALRLEVASFKYDSHVRLVVFSPDGNALAIITDNGTLRILRAVSLEEADRDWRALAR